MMMLRMRLGQQRLLSSGPSSKQRLLQLGHDIIAWAVYTKKTL